MVRFLALKHWRDENGRPLRSISDIDNDISHILQTLLSLPRSHPQCPALAQTVAAAHYHRYKLSGQKQDLDRSILRFTQAIFIPHPWVGPNQNIFQVFFLLAFELLRRLQDFEQPSDVEHCIRYLRYLLSQPLETFGTSRNEVKEHLAIALSLQLQVQSGIGDAERDIDEMAAICREFLNSGISGKHLKSAILFMCNAVYSNLERFPWQEPPRQVVECVREANKRLESHRSARWLAQLLSAGFQVTHSNDDYEEAMALLQKIMATSHEDCSEQCAEDTSKVTIDLALHRFALSGNPESLEAAIARCRTFLSIASIDDPSRPQYIRILENLVGTRSRYSGITDGLQEVRSSSIATAYLPSFSNLNASLAVKSYDRMTSEERYQHDHAFDYIHRIRDVKDIREAIKYCRQLLASLHPNNPYALRPALSLGGLLLIPSQLTDSDTFDSESLNESIAVLRNILKIQSIRWANFRVIRRLIKLLSVRTVLLGGRNDLDEVMRLFPQAANDLHATVLDRFKLSCDWATAARTNSHIDTSTAYESAISLMQDSLLFSPTLETQHFTLVALGKCYEELPLDLASYQVDKGELEHAIEALERGRALLWSEMRGFRISIDRLLHLVDSRLVEEFTAVNRKLETLTISNFLGAVMDDDIVEGGQEMGRFSRLVVQQRKLLAKRDELISQIQGFPGFKNFLRTQPFDNLRSAAAYGPVIIINHSKWRSDILILLCDNQTSLITTDDDFYSLAIELRNRLVRMRNECVLESKRYQRALRSVLKSLYELVGQPVIKELRRLKIQEQSRVWWCPTSVFCSLPLHAMGPIPSNDGVKRYFSDLYIPSYTPTLAALIESRKPVRTSLEKPSVLLVANSDEYMRDAMREIWLVQRLSTKVTTLIGKRATRSAVLERLQDHQFSHFVCHGKLEPEKPFNASFKLYGGDHLTLLDIVQSRPSTAEFAFLSACHTAELTDGSIADEGLHLTAAVQYCGFRSVVGTMWAMADQDGEGLAERFYKSMFSNDEKGVPYYERSAKALRDAVQSLRSERALPLEQWVNFVHYGA